MLELYYINFFLLFQNSFIRILKSQTILRVNLSSFFINLIVIFRHSPNATWHSRNLLLICEINKINKRKKRRGGGGKKEKEKKIREKKESRFFVMLNRGNFSGTLSGSENFLSGFIHDAVIAS